MQMAAAADRRWNTTATEQGVKEALSQIIAENGGNIVFINIDWKAAATEQTSRVEPGTSDKKTAGVFFAAATGKREVLPKELAAQEHAAASSSDYAAEQLLHAYSPEIDDTKVVAASIAATKHNEDLQREHFSVVSELPLHELQPGMQMIYAIINELLGKITFRSADAEKMLITMLQDESNLPQSTYLDVTEVFSPIFFHYPKPLKDRSVWKPKDTGKYICQWYNYAEMRTWIRLDANATEPRIKLSEDEISRIKKQFQQENLMTDLRPHQKNKTALYYEKICEAKMKNEVGHVQLATAIWAIGLPRVRKLATEQNDGQLSPVDVEAVQEAIQNVLHWLHRIASFFMESKKSAEYQETARKAGDTYGDSGRTATEQALQHFRVINKTKAAIRTAKELDEKWHAGTLTATTWYPWQRRLLTAFWNGSLDRRLKNLVKQPRALSM